MVEHCSHRTLNTLGILNYSHKTVNSFHLSHQRIQLKCTKFNIINESKVAGNVASELLAHCDIAKLEDKRVRGDLDSLYLISTQLSSHLQAQEVISKLGHAAIPYEDR